MERPGRRPAARRAIIATVRPPLQRSDLADDPLHQLRAWLAEAQGAGMPDPNAMTVATVDAGGQPSARVVLVQSLDDGTLWFYTNYGSRKGRDLAANGSVAAVFHWRELERQVVVLGTAARTTPAESDAYFESRPRGSRIGAWASRQGAVLGSREELMAAVAAAEARFDGADAIPRPDYWGGYRITPSSVEFWQYGESRLHDRFVYVPAAGGGWDVLRLSP